MVTHPCYDTLMKSLLSKITKELVVGALISLIIIIAFIWAMNFFGEDTVRSAVEASGVWTPVVLILMKILTIVVAPVSGLPLYLMAGTIFGVGEGFLYIIIGDSFGYTSAFFIARKLGRHRVEAFISKNESGLLSRLVGHLSTVKGFVVSCFSFAFAPEIVAYAAGLSRLPFKYFFPIFITGDALGAILIIWTSNKVGARFELIIAITAVLILIGLLSRWVVKKNKYDSKKQH